jgi:hypothetical protein
MFFSVIYIFRNIGIIGLVNFYHLLSSGIDTAHEES